MKFIQVEYLVSLHIEIIQKEVDSMFQLRKIFGERIIKTGISTFLTALICIWLNLPPIFAVITAIVTIEPTAKASLKKAYVRFPASIIGTFIAVVSLFIFGETAITYAIAATLTILVTYRLKLYDGVLVAAITAVAMIPSVQDAYVYHFTSRLATTMIGLTTSTVINYLVLPPQYTDRIKELATSAKEDIQKLLNKRLKELTDEKFQSVKSDKNYKAIQKTMNEAEQLLQFQHDEYSYLRFNEEGLRDLNKIQRELQFIKLYLIHVGNLIYTPRNLNLKFTQKELDTLEKVLPLIDEDMSKVDVDHPVLEDLYDCIKELDEDSVFKAHLLNEIILLFRMLINHDKTTDVTNVKKDDN